MYPNTRMGGLVEDAQARLDEEIAKRTTDKVRALLLIGIATSAIAGLAVGVLIGYSVKR